MVYDLLLVDLSILSGNNIHKDDTTESTYTYQHNNNLTMHTTQFIWIDCKETNRYMYIYIYIKITNVMLMIIRTLTLVHSYNIIVFLDIPVPEPTFFHIGLKGLCSVFDGSCILLACGRYGCESPPNTSRLRKTCWLGSTARNANSTGTGGDFQCHSFGVHVLRYTVWRSFANAELSYTVLACLVSL